MRDSVSRGGCRLDVAESADANTLGAACVGWTRRGIASARRCQASISRTTQRRLRWQNQTDYD